MKSIIATLVLAAAALVSFSGSAQAGGYGYSSYGSYGYSNSYYTPSYTPVYRPVYVQPVYPTYNYGYGSSHCW